MTRASRTVQQYSNTSIEFSGMSQVEDRQKRLQSLWGQMNTVVKQICKQRDAAHFLSPVDVEKLKVSSIMVCSR